jgi:hypothetical protein
MATEILLNSKVYAGQHDLSGDINSGRLRYGAEAVMATTFGGNGWKQRKAGLRATELEYAGFVNEGADLSGDILFGRLAVADVPLSVVPQSGAVGDVAFFFKSQETGYEPGGQIGQVYAFRVNAEANGAPVRGRVLIAAGAKTTTGTSVVRQFTGGVSATQRLYAALHVLDASGTNPTLDVVVKSDDASGFASPTTRLTFTQATGKTSELLSLAGAITDSYIRVDYTIGGTGSPSFSFVVVVGVGALG